MATSNKKLGNDFEQELCEKLSEYGFWVHPLNMNRAGQPADIIAVKNKEAYLIDAKVCSSRGFALSRVEDNQELAMSLWSEYGNGQAWFALQIPTGEIYMIPHIWMLSLKRKKASLSFTEIQEIGISLGKWVSKCE